MPVFALYNFDEAGSPVLDSALDNGAQNGKYINGASPVGGQAVLDGFDDLIKIYQDPSFQMDRGTLEIQFTQTAHVGSGSNTLLSRDSVGENTGGYRIDVLADGSIQIVHETAGGSESFGTPADFLNPGDEISLSYSWDEGGTGGRLVIENTTTGTTFDAPVPNTLTMDQGGINQPWIIGAGQTLSNPDQLNDINQHFNGTVEMFSISDTVDNNTPQDPTANPDTAVTDEDTPVIIPVLANDTDPNGQPLTISTATAPNGTVTVNPDGTVTYTPNDDFNGPDTITYTVTDPDGNTSTSTVTVTVNPVNDAPDANPDASVTPFNTPVTFAVLGNDTDVDGDTLAISGTPTSAQGTVGINADGTLTFTPNAGFTGEAVVNYTIVDEEGLTDTTTWTITVGTGPERDGIVTGTAGGDLIDTAYIDPTDADRVDAGDALLPGEVGDDDIIRAGAGDDTIIAGLGNDEVDAGEGNDSVNGNDGDDSILGGAGNDSVFGDSGNDAVDAGAGNDEVVGGLGQDTIIGGAGDDALQGNEGNDALRGDLGNDTLLGGAGDDNLVSGEVGNPDRTYPGLYTADLNPDDDRDSVIAGIGNDVVSTGDDADTVQGGDGEDTVYAGFDADLVSGGNDNDIVLGDEGADTIRGDAGDDLIYGGTIENSGPTDLIDADDLDDDNNRDSLDGGAGDDSIYGGDDADTISGGEGADVLDGGIDDDSILGDAGADTITGGEGDDTVDGGAGNDLLTDGVGADSAVGGADQDTFVGANAGDSVDGSETGDDLDTLDLRGLGPISIAYDPANAENGTVTFLDAAGAPTGTMNFVNIENVLSDLPDATPDTATTPEDTPVTIPVLANDTDGNGQPLTISGTPTAPNGTVTVNPDGTLTYTPNDDFNGTDTITYTVTDPDGNTATSTVTVTVTPVNDAPEANPDTSVTPLNTPVTFGVLGNDTDVDGDTLAITGTPTSANGTVAVNPDGTLTFTPTTGFTGVAVVNYEIVDEEGLTDTTTWTITVGDVETPVANPDTATTPEDTPVVIPVLGNDTDPNGQPLTVTGTPTAPNGTVAVNPDGTLTYTPNDDFTGTDTITYTITDPDGNEATTTVTVTVTPVNDAPEANPDTSVTPFNTPVTFAVLGNDTDVDGDTLALFGTPTSPNGTVAVNPDGTLTFTPTPGFTGEAVVNYAIVDEEGLTDTTTWTITVGDDTRDGIVYGTTGDDLIDVNYTGDNDGDFVDRGDAILPGDAPNDDVIYAGAGNDTVLAGLGDDSVRGGGGNDSILGDVGDDSLAGGMGNDTLIGGEGDDSLRGMIGADSLVGGAGDDTLAGGAGNDTLDGGDGNDFVRGMDGNDVINTAGTSGAPLPDVDYPGVYPADADPLNDLDTVYGGTGNDTISTGDDADEIFGGIGNDVIDAGIDSDLVYAGDGTDTVTGSEGRDTIYGNTGDDLIYGGLPPGVLDGLNIPDATDLRPLNNADSLFGGQGNDTIFGQDDADTLFGDLGNDSLDGGIDNDSIFGGIGNDTIIGGQGADTMAGGADRDVFVGANAGDVIDGNEGGDDFDTMDLTGSGPLRIVYADDNPENGVVTFLDADGNPTGTMNFVNIENVIPCFTPGTMIATPRGEVPVETLRAGDKIVTRDNGLQEIRWVGSKPLSWQEMATAPHLRPVLVKQGSLGNGLPERDMMVSPNHRLLVANDRTALYFDEHEVLVSAKHLVGSAGIHAVESMQTTYIHFMFDQHEVVLSNGAWTESFQPGDYTLKGMGNAQRNEIFELFPELKTQEGVEGYTAARKTLKRHEARLLVR